MKTFTTHLTQLYDFPDNLNKNNNFFPPQEYPAFKKV